MLLLMASVASKLLSRCFMGLESCRARSRFLEVLGPTTRTCELLPVLTGDWISASRFSHLSFVYLWLNRGRHPFIMLCAQRANLCPESHVHELTPMTGSLRLESSAKR